MSTAATVPGCTRIALPATALDVEAITFGANVRRITVYFTTDAAGTVPVTGFVSIDATQVEDDPIAMGSAFPVPGGTAWTYEVDAGRVGYANGFTLYVAVNAVSAYCFVTAEE